MCIPGPMLPAALLPANDVFYLLQDTEDEIGQVVIKDVRLQGQHFDSRYFHQVVFDHCSLIACVFEKCDFVDVIFQSCDLSNCNFRNGYFNRCRVVDTKAIGLNADNANLQSVRWDNCNLNYANFHFAKFAGVFLSCCNLQDAVLSECRWKQVAFTQTRLIGTNFFKTPLQGIDFTENELAGILLSDTQMELKGAIVRPDQAVDLAKRLGVIVKEDW